MLKLVSKGQGATKMSVEQIVKKYFPFDRLEHIIQQDKLQEGYTAFGKINLEWANL